MKRCMSTLLVCLMALCAPPAAAAPYKVMIVTWTGCEDACRGVQSHLRQSGLEVDFLLRDAGQKKNALPDFMEEAKAARVNLIVTYGTNVSLGIAGSWKDSKLPDLAPGIPKVFMIVADPVGAGLVQSLEKTGRDQVTGTFNRVPEDVNIETLRAYMPAFKRLGLLYHADERNSILKRDELAALAKTMDFELVAREMPRGADGRPQVADIAPQLNALKLAGVDFVYLGSSSFLRKNSDLLTQAAVALRLPVLSPYEAVVRNEQALLSVAARYADVGRLAGAQAEKILRGGVQAGSMPVARLTRFAIVINMQVAKKLQLVPPLDLLQIAETVN